MDLDSKAFAGFTRRQLGLAAAGAAVAMWGAWLTSEIILREPHPEIVQVQLRPILSQYIGDVARSGIPQDQASRQTVAFTQALDRTVAEMAKEGRIVLVSDAIAAGNVPDVSRQVHARAMKLAASANNQTAVAGEMQAFLQEGQ